MALISLRQLLDHAPEHGYGVPAFNVNNLAQIQAIMEAAEETRSPVILQASAGARKYAGARRASRPLGAPGRQSAFRPSHSR
jgi:fructose-bisphosphate aldolase class II